MRIVYIFAGFLACAGIVTCSAAKQKGAIAGATKKAAADEGKKAEGEVKKSAAEAEKTAEEAKAEALRNSFEQAYMGHQTAYNDGKTRIEKHEALYQEFVGAAKKKVKKNKKYKATVAEHDGLVPEMEKLGPQFDELTAFYESKKAEPVAEDVTKLNEMAPPILQKQGEYVAKYGEWKATMQTLATKYKMKIDFDKVEADSKEASETAEKVAE